MTRSEQINELAAAMAAAQAKMTGAVKSSDNPFFHSKYADLASVREACFPALTANGLSIVQFPRLISTGEHEWAVEVETILAHSSGQFMADTLVVPVTKADAQGVGSAITYARRFALGAVAGVAPEDDDAEAAVGRTRDTSRAPVAVEPDAPAGAGVSVFGTVADVRQRVGKSKAGKPYTKFVIVADDGREYSTFDRDMAEAAKLAKQSGILVEFTAKSSQYGLDLLALAATTGPGPDLGEEPLF